MNPRGPIPRCLAALDEDVFLAQGVAVVARDLAHHTQEDLVDFWRDRVVDLREAKHLAGELKRLEALMDEQRGLLKSIREYVNKVADLVRRLRSKVQGV